jgi:uncharacterized protein YndB with AHSA1/START domain
MSRVEEMTAVRATPAQAMRALLSPARIRQWVAPDVTVTVHGSTDRLLPGDRFSVEGLAGPRFDYQVEAASEREVVLSFSGPWRGEERWSFVADGADTIVRRAYDVTGADGLAALAWRTIGRPLVLAHFKLELSRFRDLVEREPGVRGEIEREPGVRGEIDSPPDSLETPTGGEASEQREPAGAGQPPRRAFEIDEG